MIAEIDYHTDEFAALCKSHKVRELYLFGSFYKGNFSDKSDVDLLVSINETDPIERGQLILSLYNKFEEYFHKRVDLITLESIRNHLFEEHVLSSRKLIYDGAKEKLYNDILNAIYLINEFLGPITLFEDYIVDLKTKSAIERQLTISR